MPSLAHHTLRFGEAMDGCAGAKGRAVVAPDCLRETVVFEEALEDREDAVLLDVWFYVAG